MEEALRQAVRRSLAESTAAAAGAAEVTAARSVGGGSIHAAFQVELAGGRRIFVKASRQAPPETFPREAEALAALAEPGALRVPGHPLAGSGGGFTFLLLEWIESGSPEKGFFEAFGRGLALLHRRTAETSGGRFGFHVDNWIGATPQPNGWKGDWVEFWRERRLGHQLHLARRSGVGNGELLRLGDLLLDRLETWIDLPEEPPCLLHGDLWGGNYLVDQAGAAVLIDPAVYYGHREADLAMTRLFGGFSSAFYRAYEEAWPLPRESEDRLVVYELYHLLNHLNLFGGSYRASCLAHLRRLVG